MKPPAVPRKGWYGAFTSIRGKLAFLGTLGVLAVLVVSLVELLALHRMLTRVEAEDIAHRAARAHRSLERHKQQKANTVMEFAIWDEAYDFVSNPGAPRFENFLSENYTGWLPARYGDRIIRIWNRKHEALLNWTDSSLVSDLRIPSENLIAATERLRTFGGFVSTIHGLFLVGSSVILRVSDDQATAEAKGYVLAAQPVDAAMAWELSKDLQESVRFLPVSNRVVVDSTVSSIVAGGDSISIRFPLFGVQGEAVGVVELRGSRKEMRGMYSFAFLIVTATLLGGTLFLVILWLAMKRLVILPLGEISAELKAMQLEGELRALNSAHPATEWQLFARAFNTTVKALKLSEERYQVLFERAVDAYVLIDSFSKTVLEANPAAEALAGCSEAEMVGRPLASIIDFSSASDQAGAFTLRRPDGSSSTVGVVTTEIQLGGISRTLVSIRDLSHYEKVQTQLRQAQKMDAIGSLAAGVAHDFNNLLGAILVANSSLRADLGDRPDYAYPLDTVDRAARRASELTRQLLRLARREQPRNVPLTLNEVVDRVVALCRRTFNPGIRIETRLDASLPSMIGDAGQLEQAVLNLCINARDAMPGGGILTLITRVRMVTEAEAQRDGNLAAGMHISLVVDDTGRGLTAEAEQHLFEPFFTTKERGEGTGLGLPTAYSTVRGHGGTIGFSNRPGSGVSFELLFPPTTAAAAPTQDAPPTRAVGGTERILVIDDDVSLRPAICRSLTRLGYSVVAAEGGWAGIKALEQDQVGFDLVLLDVIMPDLSGVETFKKLRALRPDLRVLVCSGYTAEAERQQLMNAGAEAFLPKPFDIAELSLAVREVLSRVSVSNP
jgi:two-component system cell cycle sensor histidine kinase/response regulator CckA